MRGFLLSFVRRAVPSLGLVVLLAGCAQHESGAPRAVRTSRDLGAARELGTPRDLGAQRINKRLNSMRNVLAIWGEAERNRPVKLQHMLDHVGNVLATQAEELERNSRGAAAYIDRDIRRAGERLPLYTHRALEILYGHPERIEEKAIILFY